jgi:hypothetical protein
MTALKSFCDTIHIETIKTNAEQAAHLIYYVHRTTGATAVSFAELFEMFDGAGLSRPNVSRLRKGLSKSRLVQRGKAEDTYRLSRLGEQALTKACGGYFDALKPVKVEERADLTKSPLLGTADIEDARKMAKLYVITHCYENSVRKMIEKVLLAKHGADWWDKSANSGMKSKLKDRKAKEARSKWITPRGSSELFYMDWGDLLALIRQHEADFKQLLPHYEIEHIVLSFKQWCKQLA